MENPDIRISTSALDGVRNWKISTRSELASLLKIGREKLTSLCTLRDMNEHGLFPALNAERIT